MNISNNINASDNAELKAPISSFSFNDAVFNGSLSESITESVTDIDSIALSLMTKKGRPHKMTETQISEAKLLRAKGVSLYQLAKRYNVSHTTINNVTK